MSNRQLFIKKDLTPMIGIRPILIFNLTGFFHLLCCVFLFQHDEFFSIQKLTSLHHHNVHTRWSRRTKHILTIPFHELITRFHMTTVQFPYFLTQNIIDLYRNMGRFRYTKTKRCYRIERIWVILTQYIRVRDIPPVTNR